MIFWKSERKKGETTAIFCILCIILENTVSKKKDIPDIELQQQIFGNFGAQMLQGMNN